MQEGIFSCEKLPTNTVEFCVVSDIHIANDESNTSRLFSSQSRNDYVFAKNKSQTPISGEAYTLKRFCERVMWSGRLGQFDDGQHVLVLLGDVINGECGYFASYNSAAYRMLSSSFLPWVRTGNVIYVAGNHDKEAKFHSEMTNFPHRFVMENEYSKCGIVFRHGHQFDKFCNGRNALGMLGEFASNVVVKLFPPNVEDIMRGRQVYQNHSDSNRLRDMRSLTEQASILTMSGENKRIAEGALNELKKRSNCHTIICGHTHQNPVRIDVRKSNGTLTYINSGKFAKDGYVNVVAKLKYPETDTWELL